MEMPYSKGWHDVRQKPSGKFEARWCDETGKARGKCFLTKTQAQKYAFDKAKNILDAAVGIAPLQKEFAVAFNEWLSTFSDEGTVRIYTRHLDNFVDDMPQVKYVSQLTDLVISAYDKLLSEKKWPTGRLRHNPGGRRHILKTFKAFAHWCVRKKWLLHDPFGEFEMPKSTFEGRRLDSDEFLRLTTPDERYEVDLHLRDLAILMQETMIRSETAWSLTPMDFRSPDQLAIYEQKGQPKVWISLSDKALEIVTRRLMGRKATQRLFDYWSTVDAMRQAWRKKARREGLAGVRLHDAGKITGVSELLDAGFTPKELEHVTNTNWRTLMAYYTKADRGRSFEKFQQYKRDLSQTRLGPKSTGFEGFNVAPMAQERIACTDENDSTNEQIVDVRRQKLG